MNERDYSKSRISPDNPLVITRDLQLQDSILDAVRENQFFVCLQPKFSLPEQKIVGAEVLLRWNAPEEGIIFPAEFLGAARTAGLIELLDLYALDDACAGMRKWMDSNMPVVPLSINISSSSLYTHGFVDAAIDVVKKYKIPYENVEFEFSAQFIKEFPEKLARTIAYFRKLGFCCAIDGYAQEPTTLMHVNSFNIDTLKLDCRSFVPDDEIKSVNACIQTLKATAEYKNLEVYCEGVETPYQLEQLTNAGCKLMQGYALSMPVSTRLFAKMLKKHHA